MSKLKLVLVLSFMTLILAGNEACRKDVDFASQSNVSPSPSGTESPDDSTTSTPTPKRTPTPTPKPATATPTEAPSGSETPTPEETPTPTSKASRVTLSASNYRAALLELQKAGKKSTAATKLGSLSSQKVKPENWLGDNYREQLIQGLAIDTDGDGYSDLLEVDFDSDPYDPRIFPRVHVTDLYERLMTQDADMDGLSDKEELRRGCDPKNPDSDGDGFLDGAEVLSGTDPLDAKSRPADRDGDGLSNAYESSIGTNPSSMDTDNDGLPDFLEIVVGSNPLDNDTDKDGILDGREFLIGSDPTIPEFIK